MATNVLVYCDGVMFGGREKKIISSFLSAMDFVGIGAQ